MNSKIFTEEPEQELWRTLLQYSYKSNIIKYFEAHNLPIINDSASENNIDTLSSTIAGALLQADEYYRASQTVSLHIKPLMLYYGTANMLSAMSILVSGQKSIIKNHGMQIEVNQSQKYIADVRIRFSHQADGGIHVFSKHLGFAKDLCVYNQHPWTLSDFFDSIAEINDDYNRCYSTRTSKTLMLDVVNTSDGIIEKIHIDSDQATTISQIEDFSNAYLPPQVGRNTKGDSYLVLRNRLNGMNIRKISYSGQPYLRVAHCISGKLLTIPEELNMYISLFALGSLCRYYPDIWYPFVVQDTTGEKLLVEKLLYYSRRMLPNIILNRIEGRDVTFVTDKYVPDDRIHLVGEHEVKEIISQEVESIIRQHNADNAVASRRK